jgi:hypothetical protein
MIEIVRWNQTFENADTRKRQRLKSFHCPSGIESRGLLNLLCHFENKDALAAFGVFQLICQLSATLSADARGKLVHSDFTPMSKEFVARLLRIEVCHLSAAIEILADKRVGWVRVMEVADNLPTICHPSPGFVQGEGEGEGEDREIKRAAAGSWADDEPEPPSKPNGSRRPTLAEATSYGATIGVLPETVETWFANRTRDEWMIHGNNGHARPVRNWQHDLAAAKSWRSNQTAANGQSGSPPKRRELTSNDVTL